MNTVISYPQAALLVLMIVGISLTIGYYIGKGKL